MGPETIAIAAIASTAFAAASTVKQSIDAKKQAKAQADLVARDAQFEGQRRIFEADRLRENNRRLLASQRGAAAGAGIDPSSGSALRLQTVSSEDLALELLALSYGGREADIRSDVQARSIESQGRARFFGGLTRAGAQILNGSIAASERFGDIEPDPAPVVTGSSRHKIVFGDF